MITKWFTHKWRVLLTFLGFSIAQVVLAFGLLMITSTDASRIIFFYLCSIITGALFILICVKNITLIFGWFKGTFKGADVWYILASIVVSMLAYVLTIGAGLLLVGFS